MTKLSDNSPLTLALAVAAAVCALALILVLVPSPVFAPDANIFSATGNVPTLTRADLDQPPLSAYAAITERPLFNEGRKRDVAPVTVTSAGALPALTSYRLAGVVLSSGTRLALIERIAAKQIVTVKPGDMLDGRHVDDVEDGTVVFSSQGATETLTIPIVSGWSRGGDGSQANASTAVAK